MVSSRSRLEPQRLRHAHAHRALGVAYVALLAAALFLSATGRLSRIVGIYGVYTKNASFLSSAFFGSLVEHAATFALALAILPAVIAGGWLYPLLTVYLPHRSDVVTFLGQEVREGDLVVTMGCGDVWMLGDAVRGRIDDRDGAMGVRRERRPR